MAGRTKKTGNKICPSGIAWAVKGGSTKSSPSNRRGKY